MFGLVGVNITYIGGRRDGESSRLVSGEPPAVLVVDASGGVYRWREGRYWWAIRQASDVDADDTDVSAEWRGNDPVAEDTAGPFGASVYHWTVRRRGVKGRWSAPRQVICIVLMFVVLVTSGFSWAVVGDSVTYDAREEIAQRDGYVQAYGGVDIRQGRPAVRRFVRLGYERIVIALGLNDVSYRATPAELRQRIRAVMRDDIDGANCVLWVDLKLTSNVHDNWPERAGQFNTILAELAPDYGVHVAHWSLVAPHHRDWFRPDGLHLKAAGQRGYAKFLTSRLDDFCS